MNNLDFKSLQEINLIRANKWHNGSINEWSVSDWACALAGEAGEVCDAVKKLRRTQDGIVGTRRGSEENAAKEIGKELADTVIYCDLLASRLGLDLGHCIQDKFNEVSVKFGFEERL